MLLCWCLCRSVLEILMLEGCCIAGNGSVVYSVSGVVIHKYVMVLCPGVSAKKWCFELLC